MEIARSCRIGYTKVTSIPDKDYAHGLGRVRRWCVSLGRVRRWHNLVGCCCCNNGMVEENALLMLFQCHRTTPVLISILNKG